MVYAKKHEEHPKVTEMKAKGTLPDALWETGIADLQTYVRDDAVSGGHGAVVGTTRAAKPTHRHEDAVRLSRCRGGRSTAAERWGGRGWARPMGRL